MQKKGPKVHDPQSAHAVASDEKHEAGRVTVTAKDGRTDDSVEQQFSKNDSDLSDTYQRLQQVQVKY